MMKISWQRKPGAKNSIFPATKEILMKPEDTFEGQVALVTQAPESFISEGRKRTARKP
jgi:hypothetical protein